MADIEAADKPQPLPQEGCNYRLAVNPQTGEHGYEIGYWPADATQVSDYVVLARCYDQQEAARIATEKNREAVGPYGHKPDHDEPEVDAIAEEEEEETRHRAGRKRRG